MIVRVQEKIDYNHYDPETKTWGVKSLGYEVIMNGVVVSTQPTREAAVRLKERYEYANELNRTDIYSRGT